MATLIALLWFHLGTRGDSESPAIARASPVIRSRPGSLADSISWSADVRLFASAGTDSDVDVRDRETGRLLKTLGTPGDESPSGLRSLRSNLVAFSPDASSLAVGESEDGVSVRDVHG